MRQTLTTLLLLISLLSFSQKKELYYLWVNRLIGDQQPDAPEKFTYITQAFYRADSPLMESGLIGPVKLVSIKKK
ncbi:MAG: hypothetical protein JXN62_06460 [Bacteroidales bacterium]|nr:hypothetical protein [Bacteroidales bacterium]